MSVELWQYLVDIGYMYSYIICRVKIIVMLVMVIVISICNFEWWVPELILHQLHNRLALQDFGVVCIIMLQGGARIFHVGEVTPCQSYGIHQIVMFLPPVVSCLLKKGYKRGVAAPQDPLATFLWWTVHESPLLSWFTHELFGKWVYCTRKRQVTSATFLGILYNEKVFHNFFIPLP